MRSPWPWIAFATAGWASGDIFAKLALRQGIDPVALTLIRFVVAAAGIVVLLGAAGRIGTDHDWRRGGLVGVVNMALPPVFFTIALVTLDVSIAGLLIALIPTSTVMAAHVLVPGERFRAWRIPGLVLAFVGIGVLLGGVDRIDPGPLWGAVAWSMVGVVLAGAGGALSRRFALQTSVDRMVIPQFLAAAVTLAIVAVPTGAASSLSEVSSEAWLWSVAAGLLGTITPFYSFLKVVERAETARASMIGYLVPVTSATAAVIFLGDPVTSSLLTGGLIIVAGVVLADRGFPNATRPRRPARVGAGPR